MCPPVSVPPPADIGVYWTDEEVFRYLEEHTHGSPFPGNVLTDVNPYHYSPSTLPDGIWYYRLSEDKKDMDHGFWKSKGEASEIFTNSHFTGWRTTLEFYEGRASHGRKTDWVMQEYRITWKSLYKSSGPKESGSLCRIFQSAGQSSNLETHRQQCNTNAARGRQLVPAAVPDAESTSEKGSVTESQVKNWDECFSRGDYLELDDLADSESRSSSSGNSSRLSLSSDECFDSEALLQLLDDKTDQVLQGKDANLKFSVSASVKPKEVLMRPASSGALISGDGSKSAPKGTPSSYPSLTGSAIEGKNAVKGVPEHATKSQKAEHSNVEGDSKSCNVATTSSSHKATSEGKRKAKRNYLCFMPF